ncbi:universal stress protein [Actinomycetaceae bacterium TAE3-ERU4]|nr:universal stress protein [Actinomycetaceae bacterium TAE3-ERU4]
MSVAVAYFNTAESEAALKVAIKVCERTSQNLIILTSLSQSDTPGADSEEGLWAALEEANIAFERHVAVLGQSVSEQLIELAKINKTEAVVIGILPGQMGIDAVGQNVQKVLLSAPCPVITVTAK